LCFRCGFKGTALPEVSGCRSDWKAFVRGLGEPSRGTSGPPVDLGGCLYPLLVGSPPRGTPVALASRYLNSRGVTDYQINRYSVSVKPFDGRVWFPYWEGGAVTWAMGRSLGFAEPKTLDSGGEKPLFGIHVSKPVGDVFVVEGIFDHLVTPSSVAICGSTISRHQLFSLCSLEPNRVFVLLDPDAEDKSVQVASDCRSVGLKAWPVLWRGNDKDPSSCGRVLMTRLVSTVRESAPVRPQAVRLHV